MFIYKNILIIILINFLISEVNHNHNHEHNNEFGIAIGLIPSHENKDYNLGLHLGINF